MTQIDCIRNKVSIFSLAGGYMNLIKNVNPSPAEPKYVLPLQTV